MKNLKGFIYLFLAFSLAGTGVIAGRLVTGKLGTFTIASASLVFALLFLVPFSMKTLRAVLSQLHAKDILHMAVQAAVGIALFRLFLLTGLRFTTTAEAGILTGATPAITALAAMLVLREHANWKTIAGITGTIAGILLIQGLLSRNNSFSASHFWGNMLVIGAAASESSFNIFSRAYAVKKAQNNETHIQPITQTTIVSAFALAFCLPPALLEKPFPHLAAIGASEWMALIWYGVFVTALAFICWYSGIRRSSALAAAAFTGMMPFTSMVLSAVILGEYAQATQWVGGMLVILGMVLIGIAGQATSP